MAYEMVFLESADLLKYQLYAQLVRVADRELSITDIAREMGTKYQATYSVFQEVINDITDETGKPGKAVRKALLSPGVLPMSLDAYRAVLLKRSLIFQLLDYAMQRNDPQLSVFLDEHFISRSTMTRKLSPVNKFLKRWGLRFRLAQMRFVGPEMSVRYFLFTLYWWGYRGLEWPFDTIRHPDMRAERDALSIMGANMLSRLQDEYFLAINHLRLSKQFRLPEHRFFDHLNLWIDRYAMRRGKAKATVPMNTVAFFNFFQMSVPRFDSASRKPEMLAMIRQLLSTPETTRVVDTLAEAADTLVPPVPDADLRLNLLRLSFGYLLLEAPFPQTQEYLMDGVGGPGDQAVEALLRQYLEPLLLASRYADHLEQLGGFIHQAGKLLEPYLQANLRTRQVRVQLCLAPEHADYPELCAYINSVSWVAQTTEEDGDVIVLDDLTEPPAAAKAHPERVVRWVDGAMALRAFREQLVAKILAARQQLK